MPKILDEELAEHALLQASLLLEDARGAVFAVRDVEGDGAPGRDRQVLGLLQQAGRAAAQGEEDDPDSSRRSRAA